VPHLLNYDSPKELRAFLEQRGLGMRKKHGQNFLINPAVRARLLDALELRPGDRVWEIGPGLGAMTAGLLQRDARVTAFEIDPAFVKALREFFVDDESSASGAFSLIEGDVMKTWRNAAAAENGQELFLAGNLPYNIAAALLADFIEKGQFFTRLVVTVQREVARRMAAQPGSSDYSSFSVLCSSVYRVTPLAVIKPAAFYPPPHVDSQGVRLDLLPADRRALPRLFYPLVRGLFSSRRKTVKNTLSAFAASVIIEGKMSGTDAALEALRRAGLAPERRPETLGIDEFAALAAFLEEIVFDGR